MTKLLEKRNKERSISSRKRIVILYHKNCTDGFVAAWAAWKKFKNRAVYHAVDHQVPPPTGLFGKEIYMVDFTYPLPIIHELQKRNIRVTAIDHHVSAEHATKATFQYSYAVKHSGAALSWMYFHKKKKIPVLVKYVEDMDLWRFQLPHTKEIFSYLNLFDFNFKLWDKIIHKFEKKSWKKEVIKKGSIILQYENKLIERLISRNKEQVSFAGYKTYVVNSPNFQSEIGNILAKKYPPIGIIWNEDANRIKVSLRSNGIVDVSSIAQKFGGGGHKAAAGFSLPKGSVFPWKRSKK